MNKEEILKKIDKMDKLDVVKLVREALKESQIKYEENDGKIVFNGLPKV